MYIYPKLNTIKKLIYIFFILVSVKAYSQKETEEKYKRYTSSEALPSTILYNLFSDSRGLLWISGNIGLTRFDGRNFINYSVKEGASDNEVFQVCEDGSKNIWFNTLSGVPCYIDKDWKVHQFNPKEFGDTTTIIYMLHDRSNYSWFSDSKGNVFCYEGNKLKKIYQTLPSLNNIKTRVDGIIQDKSGKIWFTTNESQFIYLLKNDSLVRITLNEKAEKHITPHKPILLENGNLLIFSNTYFSIFNPNTLKVEFVKSMELVEGNKVTCVYESKNKNIWIGTTQGIIEYEFISHNNYKFKDHTLKDEKVSTIIQDFEGHYWVGTVNKGLIFIHGYPIKYLHFENSSNNSTLTLSEDGENVYAGNDNGEIHYIINDSIIKKVDLESSNVAFRRVMTSKQMPNGTTWFGLDNCILIIEKEKLIKKLDISPVKKITFIGNYAYIGTSSSIIKIDIYTYEVVASIRSGRVSAIQNINNELVFANEKGLFKLKSDHSFDSLYLKKDFGNARISDIQYNKQNQCVFVSTYGQGVFVLRNGFVNAQFDTYSGLNSNFVYSIDVKDSIMHIATNKGVNKILYNKDGMLDFRSFDHKNGLPSDEVNDIIFHNNKLYLSTVDGLCIIDELEAERSPNRPLIIFDGVYSNGKKIEIKTLKNPIILDQNQNVLSFKFIGIAYQTSDFFRFNYRILEMDSNYTITQSSSLNVSDLKPGKYTLEAYAVDHQGVKSTEHIKITFIVQSHYWNSIWFYVFISFIAIVVLVFAILIRIKSIKQKEEEKTRLNKMLSELELTALKAQMNPHFIFNSLGSIQNLINRDKKTEANIYLSKFAKLLRLTLDNSDKKEIPLADEINMLELYLGLEALRFNNQFEFKINLADNVDIYENKIPTLIIQPFCENAIKHGLLPKKADAMLTINFTLIDNDSILACEIIDNGIGRVQREKLKENAVISHVSKGIKITKNRLELVNHLRNKPAEIKITDLYHQDGSAAGTKVLVTIPLDTED